MVSSFLFVPVYISLLGEEAYGLVTFFTTLQTVLNLLGLGLSKTLRREFAADESSGKDACYKYRALRSIEFIYGIISVFIVVLCGVGAHYLSTRYLVLETLDTQSAELAIRMMGWSIAAQLLSNLYVGCLFGQERQVLANALQIAWSAAKSIGVIAVLFFVSNNVVAFYTWHASIDLLYAVILRFIIMQSLYKSKLPLRWIPRDILQLKELLRFALGLMIVSIGYTINTQADKMIISGAFSLSQLGAYNTAYQLGSSTSILVSAMGIALFPRLTNHFTAGREADMNGLYVLSCQLGYIPTMMFGVYLALFSNEILLLWTRSEQIAAAMEWAAPLLIIGSLMNSLQELPYNYFLSRGITIVNNIQTSVCILYVVTVTPVLIRYYGLVGAGLAWLVEMLVSTCVYIAYFYHSFFKGSVLKRFAVDFLFPLLAALITAAACRVLCSYLSLNAGMTLVFAIIAGLSSMLLMLIKYFGTDIREILSRFE